MPSSYTVRHRFEKQFTGENRNTWGEKLNTFIDRLDFALGGHAIITLTGVDHTLTTSNTSDDEARAGCLQFEGTGGCNITLPTLEKLYVVDNACSSGAVVLTTGAGRTTSVDPGDVVAISVNSDGDVDAHGYSVGGNRLSIKQYIDAVVLGTISGLPSVIGNAGKFMYTNGSSALWRLPVVGDISDYGSDQTTRHAATLNSAKALAIAFAVAL